MESMMQKYMSAVDSKSEEIVDLRVSLSHCQSDLDRKDDICQQQALKISDLNQTIERYEAESSEMRTKLNACQSELDKKNDLCQQQASKIINLNQTIKKLQATLASENGLRMSRSTELRSDLFY